MGSVPGALATAARKAVRPAKPAGSHRGLGAVAAVTRHWAQAHNRGTSRAGSPRSRAAAVVAVPAPG